MYQFRYNIRLCLKLNLLNSPERELKQSLKSIDNYESVLNRTSTLYEM